MNLVCTHCDRYDAFPLRAEPLCWTCAEKITPDEATERQEDKAMTETKQTCWICGELGYGETYLGNTHICFVCREKIKPQRTDFGPVLKPYGAMDVIIETMGENQWQTL